jgi:hypothetical protein
MEGRLEDRDLDLVEEWELEADDGTPDTLRESAGEGGAGLLE